MKLQFQKPQQRSQQTDPKIYGPTYTSQNLLLCCLYVHEKQRTEQNKYTSLIKKDAERLISLEEECPFAGWTTPATVSGVSPQRVAAVWLEKQPAQYFPPVPSLCLETLGAHGSQSRQAKGPSGTPLSFLSTSLYS